jgi:hypothetical protein
MPKNNNMHTHITHTRTHTYMHTLLLTCANGVPPASTARDEDGEHEHESTVGLRRV